MEVIKIHALHTLERGLPSGLEAVNGRIGHDRDDNIMKSAEWEKVRNILYPAKLEDGLLSGLGEIVKNSHSSVETAWKACKDSLTLLSALLDLLGVIKKTPRSSELLGALQIAWDSFDIGASALQHVCEGSLTGKDSTTVSLNKLESHLAKADDASFQALRATLSSTIDQFDRIEFHRHAFENVFEDKRLDASLISQKSCDQSAQGECTVLAIREKWRRAGMGSPYQFSIGKGYLQLEAYVKRFQSLPPATVTNGSVTIPEYFGTFNTKIDPSVRWGGVNDLMTRMSIYGIVTKARDECRRKGDITGTWTDIEGMKAAEDFDKLIAEQQCLIKALSGKDGPWISADRRGDNALSLRQRALAASSLRECLDTTLEYINELSDLVKTFRTEVVGRVSRLMPNIQLDMQDLHASMFFGDDEDRDEAADRLKKSIESGYNRLLGTLPRDNFSEAGFGSGQHYSSRCREGAQRIIYGLNVIDASKDKSLSVKANIGAEGNQQIDTWNECQLINAHAQFLELPNNGLFDFGSVNTTGRDMQVNRESKHPFHTDFDLSFARGGFPASKPPPTVVVWISGISCSNARNYRMDVLPIKITHSGFTLRVTTWWDTKLEWLSAGWFAHPADSPYISSGRVSSYKRGHHSEVDWAPFTQISFPPRKFNSRPLVFSAISKLDFGNRFNPRMNIHIRDLTKTGMRVAAHAWWDTDNYASDAAYIVFDPRFFS